MTSDETAEFMELFREYRSHGVLPEDKRKRFRELAAIWRQDESMTSNRGRSFVLAELAEQESPNA